MHLEGVFGRAQLGGNLLVEQVIGQAPQHDPEQGEWSSATRSAGEIMGSVCRGAR